jgi:hypothetical protein
VGLKGENMVTRKGLGKGLGKGYKNLKPTFMHDRKVHATSARGIMQPQRMPAMLKLARRRAVAKLRKGLKRGMTLCTVHQVYYDSNQGRWKCPMCETEHREAIERAIKRKKKGGKFVDAHIAYQFASSNKNDSEIVLSPFYNKEDANKNPEWFAEVKKTLESRHGQTWDLTGKTDWVVSTTKGGKMSKKDYEAFAKIFATSQDRNELENRLEQYMWQDNPNFNPSKFHDKITKLKGGKLGTPIPAYKFVGVDDPKYIEYVQMPQGLETDEQFNNWVKAVEKKNNMKFTDTFVSSTTSNIGGKGAIRRGVNKIGRYDASGVKEVGRDIGSLFKKGGKTYNLKVDVKADKKAYKGNIKLNLPEGKLFGGKRIRKGRTFFQGDKIKQGSWSDKRWARARHKDNAQIGKDYEDWEKSKYQRWK